MTTSAECLSPKERRCPELSDGLRKSRLVAVCGCLTLTTILAAFAPGITGASLAIIGGGGVTAVIARTLTRAARRAEDEYRATRTRLDVLEAASLQVQGQDGAELFRTAFDSTPTLMAVLDRDNQPVAVNHAFTAVLGYSLERFTQLGWQAIVHADDCDKPPPPGEAVVKRILAADGAIIRGEIRFAPVADGRLVISIDDLTSRWETEERVRYQASLLDQVTNAVLAVDRWGRIVYGNRAALALFHWTDQEALHGVPVERLLGHEVMAVLGQARAEVETDGTNQTGTHFPAAVNLARIVDEGDQTVGTVLVVTDLTQRRAMDMQLMHSARLATLGEMSASIAHEFNQCLHVIRLSSEALSMDLADGRLDIPRVEKRAGNILSQVDRLTEMVMQMRSISRRETGGKQSFLPQAAVDSAVRMTESLMVADSIRIERVGTLDGSTTLGHQVRLEQVLINLLNNARDAIQDRQDGRTGGVVTVTCTIDEARRRLIVTVRDDGPGVPDDVATTIFDPFVTTKDGQRGCGLGLSISRGIIQEMGGSLTFRNVFPGAEFTVELPMTGTMASHEPVAAPLPPVEEVAAPAIVDVVASDDEDDEDGPGQGRRLLLVDDEALSVMMVGEFLGGLGYVVDTAYDGLAALELCETHVYDAVITDIRMPRMDGHKLIRRLEDLQPGTPVVVVTGHIKEGTEAELGPNVVAVLSKPFQLLHLRDQLDRIESGEWLRQKEGA